MLKRYDRQRDILNLLEPNQTRAIADIAKALSEIGRAHV